MLKQPVGIHTNCIPVLGSVHALAGAGSAWVNCGRKNPKNKGMENINTLNLWFMKIPFYDVNFGIID
jgi:hypothetical protein